MIRFSEYVSLGHSDKIADYISQYLLDRYIERDPETRYAVEVQVKDVYVTLGGEVTSTARFTDAEIEGTRDHRLWYAEESNSRSDFRLCSEYRMRDISDILDKHDTMIRAEIDEEIEKLKNEIKTL